MICQSQDNFPKQVDQIRARKECRLLKYFSFQQSTKTKQSSYPIEALLKTWLLKTIPFASTYSPEICSPFASYFQ